MLIQPIANLEHIPFGTFKRVANSKTLDDETLLSLVLHIVNQGKLLDIHYEFIEDDECYDVSLEELQEANNTGWLAHPEDGTAVYSYEDDVVMYFKYSALRRSFANE